MSCHFFFFNDTATTEIYTLSLHDALPIFMVALAAAGTGITMALSRAPAASDAGRRERSEEHTSELQSLTNLECRLLLEKKNSHLHGQARRTSLSGRYRKSSLMQPHRAPMR